MVYIPVKDSQLQPIRPERAVRYASSDDTPVSRQRAERRRYAPGPPVRGDNGLRQGFFAGSSADVAGSKGAAGLAEGE
jgi:hypothetical protein